MWIPLRSWKYYVLISSIRKLLEFFENKSVNFYVKFVEPKDYNPKLEFRIQAVFNLTVTHEFEW